jgi:protein-disulfide isomerase
MKKNLLLSTIALLAGSLIAADSNDVATAARTLGEKTNYTWKTTVVVPEDAQFKPGPTDGKTEKEGFTHVKMTFFDNPVQIVLKGKKAAFTDQDGAWQSAAEAEGGEGPGRFMAMMVQNFQTPAEEARELASFAKELKKDGDVYSSDLTEEGAKAKLTFRRGGGATVTNPKGSVKFWVKDGVLTKYEFKVKGTVNWNGNDFDNDRTTTVEIKDVGTTKVEVPEEARKKLS